MSTTHATTAPATDEPGSQAATEEAGFKLDRSQMATGWYKGMMMPHHSSTPLETHVPSVINLSLRVTDIILLTYPKSEGGIDTHTIMVAVHGDGGSQPGNDFEEDGGVHKREIQEEQTAASVIDLPLQYSPVKGLRMIETNVQPLESTTKTNNGTHWLWRVMTMLTSGGTTYNDRSMVNFFLDLMPTKFIDSVSPDIRRVLCTHYPSDLLPTQIKEGRVKVVHAHRHPKAVLVSMLFHMEKVGNFPDLTLDKLEAMMNASKGPYNDQFYYWDKLKEYERDNPNVDIFHLAYEDMKKDPAGCIKQLAAYLNVDASEGLCASIAEAVSFSKQKTQEESGRDIQREMNIFRKGEVDDWKNYMTVAQSERMDKILADRAASCEFCRRYCPAITTDQGHVYRLSSTS